MSWITTICFPLMPCLQQQKNLSGRRWSFIQPEINLILLWRSPGASPHGEISLVPVQQVAEETITNGPSAPAAAPGECKETERGNMIRFMSSLSKLSSPIMHEGSRRKQLHYRVDSINLRCQRRGEPLPSPAQSRARLWLASQTSRSFSSTFGRRSSN